MYFLSIPECFSDRSNSNSVIMFFLNYRFPSTLILLSFFILIAFHCECLSRASLSISKYGCMESIYYFFNKFTNPKLFKDFLLWKFIVYNFVKLVWFPSEMVAVLCFLGDSKEKNYEENMESTGWHFSLNLMWECFIYGHF